MEDEQYPYLVPRSHHAIDLTTNIHRRMISYEGR